ncbi:hypothetical protein [Kribbella sp. NPDC006257]|uniref:hypothetical protein n=1 Tax=Kribbella sp. NPDC006257 TaxID=3156738 RepID=UPI0033B4D3A8
MRWVRGVVLLGVLVAALSLPVSGPAVGPGPVQAVAVTPSPTPTPTLGSTPQPAVDPPGTADGDAHDFDDAGLAVISFVFLAALVGSSILFYFWRRSRKTRELLRHS